MFHCSGLEVPSRAEGFGDESSDHEHTWEPNLEKLQNSRSNIHRRSWGRHDS